MNLLSIIFSNISKLNRRYRDLKHKGKYQNGAQEKVKNIRDTLKIIVSMMISTMKIFIKSSWAFLKYILLLKEVRLIECTFYSIMLNRIIRISAYIIIKGYMKVKILFIKGIKILCLLIFTIKFIMFLISIIEYTNPIKGNFFIKKFLIHNRFSRFIIKLPYFFSLIIADLSKKLTAVFIEIKSLLFYINILLVGAFILVWFF